MGLWKIYIACAGLIALLHFLLIPALKRRWQNDTTTARIPKFAAYSLMEYLRTSLFVALVAYFLLFIYIFFIQQFSGATSLEIGQTISHVQTMRTFFSHINDFYTLLFMTSLITILGILAYKRGKQRARIDYQQRYTRELERLLSAYEKGELEDLPPNESMLEVEKKLQQIAEQISQLEAQKEDSDSAPELQELNNIRTDLLQLWHHLNLARRVNIEWDEPNEQETKSAGRKMRLKNLFVSEGLLSCFKGASRVLFLTGLFLLFLSFVGVSSPMVIEGLQQRLIKLEELQVEAGQKEALDAWQEVADAIQDKTGIDELTNEDNRVLDDLSGLFEDEFARAYIRSLAWGLRSANHTLRSFGVRQKIIEACVDRLPDRSNLRRYRSFTEAEGLTSAERSAAEFLDDALKRDAPQTRLGRKVRAEIKAEIPKKSTDLWQKVKTKHKSFVASFGRPARAADVTKLLLNETFGTALEGVAGAIEGEIQAQTASLLKQMGGDALDRIYEGKLKQFLFDLAGDAKLSDAAANLHSIEPRFGYATGKETTRLRSYTRKLPNGNILLEKMRPQPPGFYSTTEKRVDLLKAEKTVERIKQSALLRAGGHRPNHIADVLATYEDWFPSQYGSETHTTRGRLMTKWDPANHPPVMLSQALSEAPPGGEIPGTPGAPGGGGGGTSGDRSKSKTSSRTSPQSSRITASRSTGRFMRSRSFVRLRGFSRIGGVLIGQLPGGEDQPELDFVEFNWRFVDEGIQFILIRSDNQIFTLGPYRRSVANYALAYVADGRPVAVTMTTAPPLLELRILVHPAIEDTPLGCRVIAVDRYVDEFTRDERRRTDAENVVMAHFALYKIAWSYRLLLVLDHYGIRSGAETGLDPATQRYFISLRQIAEDWLQDGALWELAEKVLSTPQMLTDPNRSPMSSKPEFFDATLVTIITRSAEHGGTVEDFKQRFESAVKAQIEIVSREELQAWWEMPPEQVTWSGVREIPYRLDAELKFLDAATHRSQQHPFWPLDFMLQVSFTSRPGFLAESEDPEQYFDQKPWEYPAIRDLIISQVGAGITENPGHRAILNDVQEFTILQRLFRVGLDGGLGRNFPIERLVTLANELASSRTYTRTMKWNVRPGALEWALTNQLLRIDRVIAQTAEALSVSEMWVQQTRAKISDCVEFIKTTPEINRVADEVWASRCILAEMVPDLKLQCSNGNPMENQADRLACIADYAVSLMDGTQDARQLRSAMGIPQDEYQSAHLAGCAPLL